jgi:hypothetical protein
MTTSEWSITLKEWVDIVPLNIEYAEWSTQNAINKGSDYVPQMKDMSWQDQQAQNIDNKSLIGSINPFSDNSKNQEESWRTWAAQSMMVMTKDP